MFSLHETKRIRLCRAVFVALCLLPTCAVIGAAAFVRAPAYRQGHERRIEAYLGWQTRLGAISSPRPGKLLYENVELSDPATGQALALLPFVEIESTSDTLVVRLPYPATINGTRLDAFWALIGEADRNLSTSASFRIEVQNLTVRLPDGDQTFTDVVCHCGGDAKQSQAKLAFRRAIAGSQAAEPCLLTVARRREATPGDQLIQLSTGSTPLPAALFTSVWPAASRLGMSCQFSGRITAARRSGVWQTELEGRAGGIDLDLLVSHQFPHKLSGLADARLKSVKVVGGRIASAQGHVTAGPGVISRSLLQSAETHLHILTGPAVLKARSNLIAYQQLSTRFEIDEQGLALSGQIPGAKGAMLADARHVLALEPPLVSQPVVDLVRTLVPRSDVHVPATRETAQLTSALPVPSIVQAPGREQPLPHARPVSVNPVHSRDTIRR